MKERRRTNRLGEYGYAAFIICVSLPMLGVAWVVDNTAAKLKAWF